MLCPMHRCKACVIIANKADQQFELADSTVTLNLPEGLVVASTAGGVAGINDGGYIADCYNKGYVAAFRTSPISAYYAGGVSALNTGRVERSYNTGGVSAAPVTSAFAMAGGISGQNSGSGSVGNSYNKGGVSAAVTANALTVNAGGISGHTFGHVAKAYSAGDVAAVAGNSGAYAHAGGIAGEVAGAGSVRDSVYVSGEVSAMADAGYATGLLGMFVAPKYRSDAIGNTSMNGTKANNYAAASPSHAQGQVLYASLGWDFHHVWGIDPANLSHPYPYLLSLPVEAVKAELPDVGPDIRVTGTFRYRSYDDGKALRRADEPLANHEVEILLAEPYTGTLVVAKAKTDADGVLDATVDNALTVFYNENGIAQKAAGRTVSLRIKVENEYVKVAQNPTGYYRWESPAHGTGTEAVAIDFGTVNLSEESDALDGAMNIFHWVNESSDFYFTETGDRPWKNTVVWPYTWTDDSASWPVIRSIFISGVGFGDQYNASVICHEFGHQIMYEYAESLMFEGDDWWDLGANLVLEHLLNTTCSNTRMAYSEGFAAFFSSAVRNDSRYLRFRFLEDDSMGVVYTILTVYGINIETGEYMESDLLASGEISSSSWHSLTYQTPYDNNALMEAMVAGALWALYRGVPAMSYTDIDAIFRMKPKNVREFYEKLMGSALPSGKAKEIWSAFHANNVAYDVLPPTAVLSETAPHEYQVSTKDDVEVSLIEWYADGVHMSAWDNLPTVALLGPSFPVRQYVVTTQFVNRGFTCILTLMKQLQGLPQTKGGHYNEKYTLRRDGCPQVKLHPLLL